MKKIVSLICPILLAAGGFAAARNAQNEFGLPIFPGAETRPDVARAVEVYYQPGIAGKQGLTVGVFETLTPFQEVYDFYGPHMNPGKWGWRRKSRALVQHTETLKFMRAQLIAQRANKRDRLPEVFKPFFGDPNLDQREFSAKLDQLLNQNKRARIEVVEGTVTIPNDPSRSQVRVTIERPYIDINQMKLIDKTRILMVKVS